MRGATAQSKSKLKSGIKAQRTAGGVEISGVAGLGGPEFFNCTVHCPLSPDDFK